MLIRATTGPVEYAGDGSNTPLSSSIVGLLRSYNEFDK
jgi:hypothetical protein